LGVLNYTKNKKKGKKRKGQEMHVNQETRFGAELPQLNFVV